MTEMERTGGQRVNPPAFNERQDFRPGPFMTSSNQSGPYFDRETGKQLTLRSLVDALKPFFGQGNREIAQSPYADYPVENKDLPDAFVGSNSYMRQIVITMITQSDLFAVRYMFPWQKHEGSMEVNWTLVEFDDHMLNRRPEEGVSRLITQRSQQYSANLVCHGIALRLEHGFFMTPQGRENWAMHMKQIGNAVNETASYGAVVAAYTTVEYEDPNEKWRDDTSRSITDLETMFRDELSQWAALQKIEGGLGMIVSKAKAIMNNRGVGPGNVWYWPERTRWFAEGTAQESYFILSGRKSGEERDVMAAEMQGDVYSESRGFRRSSYEARHDPAFREQTIGTFFQMDDAGIRNVPPEEFRSIMMDRLIFNENKDAYEVVSFSELMGYSGLVEDWHDETKGYPLSHIGQTFFSKYSNCYEYIKDADTNDYCIDSLLAKSADVHLDFVTSLVGSQLANLSIGNYTTAGLTQTATETHTVDDTRNQRPIRGHFATKNGNYQSHSGNHFHNRHQGRTNAEYSSQRQDYDQIVEAIEKTNWDSRGKNEARSFANFLKSLPSMQTPLLSNYHRLINKYSNNRLMSSTQLNFELMAKYLFDWDKTASVSKLSQNEYEMTKLELGYHKLKDETLSAGGDQERLRSISERALELDRQSPSWLPLENRRKNIQIVVSPSTGSEALLPIHFQSLSFTISSTNLIVFAMNDDTVNSLYERRGQILIDQSNVNPNDPIQSEILRYALLQYNVTLSAIYYVVLQYVDLLQHSNAVQDQPRRSLSGNILKLLVSQDPLAGQSSTMKEAALIASKFQIIKTQIFLQNVVKPIQSLFTEYYQNRNEISTEALESHVDDIIDSIQSQDDMLQSVPQEDDDEEEESNNSYESRQRKTVGALMTSRHNMDKKLQKSVIQTYPDKKDVNYDELERKATEKINALENEIIPQQKSRESFTNSFKIYSSLYSQIWIAIDRLGIPGQPNLQNDQKENVFKAIVSWSQTLYSDPKHKFGNAALITRTYLHLVLDSLIHQKLPKEPGIKPPVDFPLFPIATQTPVGIQSRKVLTFLQAVLKEREKSLYNSAKTIIERNPKASELTYAAQTNWSTDGAVPPDTEDLTELRMIATALFAPLVDVDFANAVAIYWYEQTQVGAPPAADTRTYTQKVTEILGITDQARIEKIAAYYAGIIETNFGPSVPENTMFPRVANAATGIQNNGMNGAAYTKALKISHPGVFTPLAQPAQQQTAAVKLTKLEIENILRNMPIDGKIIKWCLRSNVYFPLQLICFRPHQRYSMGSAVHMHGGGVTGQTLYGFVDFQLTDNVVQKMHYGHYTQYMKTLIKSRKHLLLLHNILCVDYLGGNGSRPWNPLDEDDINAYVTNELNNDMFVIPEKANWKCPGAVLDITGRFHPDLGVSHLAAQQAQYTLSRLMCSIWMWKNTKALRDLPYNSQLHLGRFNTLCFQAFNRYYNHSTKTLSSEISEKGHWQNCVYEGCGKVRRGWAKQFTTPKQDINRGLLQLTI